MKKKTRKHSTKRLSSFILRYLHYYRYKHSDFKPSEIFKPNKHVN